jgi:hypothetical protein
MRRRPGSARELAALMQAEEEVQRCWARERGWTAEREESQKLHPNLNLVRPNRMAEQEPNHLEPQQVHLMCTQRQRPSALWASAHL